MAPFIANNTAGIDSYKWMLFGDDDTVFYVDNILRMLETLDHTMPYILSDHIWFPTDLKSKALMPLPCCCLVAPSCAACMCHQHISHHLAFLDHDCISNADGDARKASAPSAFCCTAHRTLADPLSQVCMAEHLQ